MCDRCINFPCACGARCEHVPVVCAYACVWDLRACTGGICEHVLWNMRACAVVCASLCCWQVCEHVLWYVRAQCLWDTCAMCVRVLLICAGGVCCRVDGVCVFVWTCDSAVNV
jgi:hypothetical protein